MLIKLSTMHLLISTSKRAVQSEELVHIAHRCEHGWATVEEYIDELADNYDNEKRLFRA